MMFRTLLTTILIFSTLSAQANKCKEMDDAQLIEFLNESEERTACRANLGLAASCVGIAAGSALAGASLLRKSAVKTIQADLYAIRELSQKLVSYQGINNMFAVGGNLRDSTEESGDGQAKKDFRRDEPKLAKHLKSVEDAYNKDPKTVARAIEKMMATKLGESHMPAIMDELRRLSYITTNEKEAKAYHHSAKVLARPLDDMRGLINANKGKLSKEVLARLSASGAVRVGSRILGSRLFGFLLGSTVGGISLGVYSSGTGCAEDYHEFVNYDKECRPLVELNQTVVDFLSLETSKQLFELRNDARVCNFYLDLTKKLRSDDAAAEKTVSELRNLSCSGGVTFQIGDSQKPTTFSISEIGDNKKILQQVGSKEAIRFDSEGAISQACAGPQCVPVQRGTSRKLVESVLGTISTVRLAASEAVACCHAEGVDKTTCQEKYGSKSSPTSSGGSSTGGASGVK